VTAVRDDVARSIDDALAAALAKDPQARLQSVSNFADALGVSLHTPRTPLPGDVPAVSLRSRPPRSGPAAISVSEQQIRFCTAADGTTIAYATVGEGPVLVKAANWLSHLEFDWHSPVWSHWWQGLARYHRLCRYDERGCGLSDWDAEDMSLEAWVSDLEAVVDAAGLDRFALLGVSQGGPIAVAYAVRHPERVSHLVIHGSYVRGHALRGTGDQHRKEVEMLAELIRVGWGSDNPTFRQVFSMMFYPDATNDQIQWFNELQQVSTSAENAVRIRRGFDHLDVRDLAPQVSVPALVLHCKHELRIPFAEGRLLASLIPGAQFVPLDCRNHIPLGDEPAWQVFLNTVYQFLGVSGGW
jgi:pimeloyl-ACP methyl ester carboxylesterase